MPSNEERKNNPPRNRGPMRVNEKPKNFGTALSKLIKSLGSFKVLIISALVLAGLSAVLSLSAPDKLSDLTNEISNGLTINTENMEALQEDLLTNLNEDVMPSLIKDILNINGNINGSDMSSLSNLSDDVLDTILTDSTYNDILVTKEDKITFVKVLSTYDKESKDYSFISNFPDSINSILFPESTIDGIVITTNDKVDFIKKMSTLTEESSANDIYKVVETLSDSIQSLVNPKMNTDKIIKMSVILLVIYLVSALFGYLEGLFMVKTSNNYARGLRNKISLKINKLPLKFFDHNLSGDILSRVTNDVDTIAQSLDNCLATLVSATTLFIGSIIMMFVTNYILAVTAIVSSLIGFILMFIILGKSQKYFTKRQEELGNLNGYIEEVYSGLNVVKTCNGLEQSCEEFEDLNKKLYQCNRKSQFLSGLMHPIMSFVGNFGYVAVCVVGALLVSKDIISFGTIVAFIVYVRLFTNPLSQIAQSMTSLQTTAAASERVFAFLEEEEMTKENSLTKKLDKNKVKGKIEFKNVKFGYDEGKIIIKDFTAKVKPGQKIAIVGPTGAGKTTMVNLLMKFYEINSGDIMIDDVSIHDLTRDNVHDLFTMVLQDTWLFNGTIKENIVYNKKNISDDKVKEVCKVVGVDHFIKTLPKGYDSIIGDSDSISAGQRQLLTIARGMIDDAPFLILDEATSNVDTRTEELVQKAMDKLMENRTSFIIAHRLSTIRNANLILVMKDGNIIETGNHDKLMEENGFYANLYNSQFDSLK